MQPTPRPHRAPKPGRNRNAAPVSSRSGLHPQKRLFPFIPLAIVGVFILAAVLFVGRALLAPANTDPAESSLGSGTTAAEDASRPASADSQKEGPSFQVLDAGRTTKTGDGRVTFSAVGDNLFNANLLELADAHAGSVGDDQYDFAPFYQNIKSLVRSFDISFINQETTLGGPDRYGYKGYPSYNTPDSLADAMADVGWRVVCTNSNHTYDTWTPAIEHAQSVWDAKRDQLITIGSYASDQDRQSVRLVECNGLRIAFLSYSYGQNGYTQADLPNDYYAVPYTTEGMQADVARAQKHADAVVVYLHAGTEYTHEPNEQQRTWAAECAAAGVDLVIGSHAHVIQSMEWLDAADGGKMLAVYGLGDFLSGYHNNPKTILSGMFTCTFERAKKPKDGERKIVVKDVAWVPLIEHWENGSSTVRTVKGYTDEQARANELLSSLDDPLGWIKQTTQDVIGPDFDIDM